MLRPWRLAFVVLVAAEIISLIWLGKALGFLGLVAYFVLSGVVGMRLIRQSGSSLSRLSGMMRSGTAGRQDASQGAAGSMLMALAGVLVILPGFVSDIAAVLLLLPITRQHVAKLLPVNIMFSSGGGFTPPTTTADTIIEGEAVEIIEPDRRLR